MGLFLSWFFLTFNHFQRLLPWRIYFVDKNIINDDAVSVDDTTTTLDAEAGGSHSEPGNKNGHSKALKRLETVPDIKRDTSGITTQYIATGIGN